MNTRNVVSSNAVHMFGRVLLSAGITFFLYKFLIHRLGPDLLGVWALILATTAIGNLGSLGLGGGLVKFVAAYDARNDIRRMNLLLQTSVVTISAVMALIALTLFLLREPILNYVLPPELVSIALSVFPLALVGFWLAMVATTYQSFLEGLQRFGLTSTVVTAGTALHAVCAFALVPDLGLEGVVVANVVSAATVLAGMIFATRVSSPMVAVLPRTWSLSELKQVFKYGTNFQLISLASMLCDPTTKFLIGRFGSVSGLGYYEMASKLVLMVRQLLISMNSVIVPAVAAAVERNHQWIKSMHRDNQDAVLIVASVLLFAPAALALPICDVWIGGMQEMFVFSTVALSIGWFVNTVSGPSYFFFLGGGKLLWVTISHVAVAILNLVLGMVGGILWGYHGIVAAFAVALFVGSAVTVVAYARIVHIPFNRMFGMPGMTLIGRSVLIVATCHCAYYATKGWLDPMAGLVLLSVLFAGLSAVSVLLHPPSRNLLQIGRHMFRDILTKSS